LLDDARYMSVVRAYYDKVWRQLGERVPAAQGEAA
jgi:hypothetical protein